MPRNGKLSCELLVNDIGAYGHNRRHAHPQPQVMPPRRLQLHRKTPVTKIKRCISHQQKHHRSPDSSHHDHQNGRLHRQKQNAPDKRADPCEHTYENPPVPRIEKVYHPQPPERVRELPRPCRQRHRDQHHADIGLEGKKQKINGRLVDAYYFCIGGAAGGHAAIARAIGYRVPSFEVAASIARLVRAYLADRRPAETFRAFCARHDDVALRAQLAGTETDAVERDPSPGPVPHAVES